MEEQRENGTQTTNGTPNEPPTSQQKKGKTGLYLKVIALALCCSLVGGVIGGAAVFWTGNHLAEKNLMEFFEKNEEFSIESRMKYIHPFVFAFSSAREFVEEEIMKEEYIGVAVTDSEDPKGALVDSVEKGSPAAQGGLQAGDIITMVNNVEIDSRVELAAAITLSEAGDELTLTVYRQGETLTCKVIVSEHSRFEG